MPGAPPHCTTTAHCTSSHHSTAPPPPTHNTTASPPYHSTTAPLPQEVASHRRWGAMQIARAVMPGNISGNGTHGADLEMGGSSSPGLAQEHREDQRLHSEFDGLKVGAGQVYPRLPSLHPSILPRTARTALLCGECLPLDNGTSDSTGRGGGGCILP